MMNDACRCSEEQFSLSSTHAHPQWRKYFAQYESTAKMIKVPLGLSPCWCNGILVADAKDHACYCNLHRQSRRPSVAPKARAVWSKANIQASSVWNHGIYVYVPCRIREWNDATLQWRLITWLERNGREQLSIIIIIIYFGPPENQFPVKAAYPTPYPPTYYYFAVNALIHLRNTEFNP